MLKFMRTHATSWIIKILLGLIIVVFIFWGMGSVRSKRETVVATVGGYDITKGEFEHTYNTLLRYYTRVFGGQLPPDLLERMNIKQQVLDRLLNLALIVQGGQRLGLRVTEEELGNAIHQHPAFQRYGKFEYELYLQFLRDQGLESGDFLDIFARELVASHMEGFIGDTAVIIPEEEAEELYFLENERIDLEFIKVSPHAFTGKVAVTPQEMEGYYAEHKEEFRTPPQVKVVYLRFSPQAYLTETTVSPQEIQEYYDMNIEQYRRPKRVRVRHILFKVGPEAGPDEVKEAREKAQKVLAEARREADFAALARRYSDDPSGATGGDLGYFTPGEMDPILEKAVSPLGKGDISPLVRTRQGFHIVKVDDVQEGAVKTLEEVKGGIVSFLMNEKAKDLAAIHAEDAAYKAKGKGELRTYAEQEGLQLREAGPFKPGEPIKELGDRKTFSSIAFTLGKGDISSAFQDGDDHFILQVVDKIPPQIPPLQEVQEAVKEGLTSSLAKESAQSAARDLLTAWREGKGFRELLWAHGLQVEETGYFKRSSASPPHIGPLGIHAGQVAALTLEEPWPEEVIEVADVYWVIKLRDVQEASHTEYEKEEETYGQLLSSRKREELLQRWLQEMKERVDIEINQELLGSYR